MLMFLTGVACVLGLSLLGFLLLLWRAPTLPQADEPFEPRKVHLRAVDPA